MISIFSNTLGEEELKAVSEVFQSRWLGKGKQCDLFEKEFAQFLNVDETLLLNNCTAGIYIGLKSIGVQPGDEVIISSLNFVACANAVIELGAKPVFADVDPRTLNILPKEINRLKTDKTKAVIILHYGGHPCPMDEIKAACGENIQIFEDSANSIHSSYKGKMCGTFDAAGVWSFDAMKMLVMTDGGGLYLRDDDARKVAKVYRYLGFAPKATSGMDAMKAKQSRWWEYELAGISGRFISNDVMAAIGRVQLKKISEFIQRKKQIWSYYQQEMANVPQIVCPPEPIENATSSYYLYWLQTSEKRDELAIYLADNGVYSTFRYFPLHLVQYYSANCKLPNSEKVNEITLNIPLHQNLTDGDVQKIVDLIKKFIRTD